MFVLVNILITLGLALLEGLLHFQIAGKGILSTLYALGTAIPWLAVSARRLHDTNRSAWWLLLYLLPFVGTLVLFVFFVLDSTPGTNRFGPNPKGEDTEPGHSLSF